MYSSNIFFFFFFNDTAPTEIYTNLNTLSLHDALPIFRIFLSWHRIPVRHRKSKNERSEEHTSELQSHSEISYAVFCLKKKKKNYKIATRLQAPSVNDKIFKGVILGPSLLCCIVPFDAF